MFASNKEPSSMLIPSGCKKDIGKYKKSEYTSNIFDNIYLNEKMKKKL